MTKVIQANLQHSKAATAVLCDLTAKNAVDFALIQEPWVRGDKITGLGLSKGLTISASVNSPRACIWVKNGLRCAPVSEFCSRDQAVARTWCGGTGRPLLMASVYMPRDAPHAPPHDLARLVEFAARTGTELVVGSDSNAHNTAWGCKDTNTRGKTLLDFIAANGLIISNVGSEPTFVSRVGQSVIDLTLTTGGMVDRIKDWRVSSEPSLSDHRHILFTLGDFVPEKILFRNPRKADWDLYCESLRERVERWSPRVADSSDLDQAAAKLGEAIVSSFDGSCPLSEGKGGRINWWTSALTNLRKKVRAHFKKAKISGSWEVYHSLLTEYNKAVRRAKRLSWKNFCSNLEGIKDTSRIYKVLAKDRLFSLGALTGPSGEEIHNPREVLELMATTHFPGCDILQQPGTLGADGAPLRASVTQWNAARRIVTFSKIRWAVNSLSPYKSPGPDGIRPIHLQKGMDIIIHILCRLFRASLALGHIPMAWSCSRVVFIPKPAKDRYTDPKSFRPISLSSFLLKTLEKLVLRHVWDKVLRDRPFHRNQHAYIPGKSCESALHHLVGRIEGALEHKEIALGAFLDIQGAFDNTSTAAVLNAARSHGFDGVVLKWTEALLLSRKVQLSLHGEEVVALTRRGCPQGGVLSPVLWNLVADDIIRRLNDAGVLALGYADDIAILVVGKFSSTIKDLMNRALKQVDDWCSEVGLAINPSKVVAVPFTRRRNLQGLGPLTLKGREIELQNQVKYLGVILDRSLSWEPHLQRVIDRGKWSLMTCRRMSGSLWGLQPKLMQWLYVAVVRPAMTYGSLVWWTKMNSETAVRRLAGTQRLACLLISGAMSTCPGASLDCLLNILPIDIFIKATARKSAYRLQCENLWTTSNVPIGHSRINQVVGGDVLDMPSDHLHKKYAFGKSFSVVIPTRDDWKDGKKPLPCEMEWYTDGSKGVEGTGAGILGAQDGVTINIPMGKFPTVFQAEVTAIMECAMYNLSIGVRDKNITIFSDSQAALRALDSCTFNSRLVWDCHKAVSALGSLNNVTLCWVPGHSGIKGNEIADRLANQGASVAPLGPQPFCGISRAHAGHCIMAWARESHRAKWLGTPLLRVSKLTLCSPSSRVASDLLRLGRSESRLVIGLITGHGIMRKHLARMGIYTGDPVCRKCGQHEETADHLLYDCTELREVRAATFGHGMERGRFLPQEELIGKLQQFSRLLRLGET